MGNALSQPAPQAPTSKDRIIWHPLQIEEHPIDVAPKLKVIVVGAGIAGINAAILLPVKVPGIELVIYERESDIGGVWHQCTYPGVRCDVPSHVYQSTFSPSRDWSEHYAAGTEIKSYWHQVTTKYDTWKYMRCDHEVQSAIWIEEKTKWVVTIKHSNTEIVDEADCVIMAIGIFSHPTLPKYPGMEDYEGHLCHSSRWDANFDPTGKRVAVIGNGSSGLQLLPQLQKVAARIDHYARSPTWVGGSFGPKVSASENAVSHDLRSSFANPETYLRYRKGLESPSFTGFGAITKDGMNSKLNREKFHEEMKARLGDRTDLLEAIEPDFSPSCRRLTPGPGYLEALTQPNVDDITSTIERFTKNGIRTADGKERKVDAIICCTGSEKSFAPPFPVMREGIDLSSAWKPGRSIGFPNTYMGIAAPGFPNLFFVNGPTAAAATGTLPFATENQITLIARVLRKMQSQGIRTITPSFQATEDFRAYCEAYFPRTVLSENCSSWFNGGIKGGRVIASWPGSGLHANVVRREPRWEDWEYTYRSSSENRFAYFGNGWTQKDVEVSQEGLEKSQVDMTPYLQLDSVTGRVDLRGYHETWFDV
ncbi:putative flavin-binding monooxygenase [Mollisia scopiformis]|uniref:Putative flavin-binding monooxygenase n=1 Tax=Mollisia scopiformis TaxID=149040 RepID=A0A132B9M2_MOLSC|nr:putative flavin-binding monooxygenase [Mollisia scopiformis]KUJ09071.1 putative flavin-binding monooxygenase [Mollisia scopiformis]